MFLYQLKSYMFLIISIYLLRFSCGTCFKAFNQKNALKKHILKHSGERPFVCPFCAYAFNQKGNLKTHIQRTHSEQAQQLIEKELVQTQ